MTVSFRVVMGLRPTHENESHSRRHPRASGGPRQSASWIPAFAAMTGRVTFDGAQRGISFCSKADRELEAG